MYKIRLSNGTEYNVRFCGARGDLLTMSVLSEADFLTVAQTIGDNSQTVLFLFDSSQQELVGYTELVLVNNINPGEYLVTLRKGAGA